MKTVKNLRSGMLHRLQKLGAQGSTRQAHLGEDAPRKYAAGGAIPSLGGVDGKASAPRLDKAGRSKGGKGKKEGKTNINIIVAGGGKPEGPPPLPMGGPPMPPPGGMMKPPMPPPGPPPGGPGMGGPPMPMHAAGGRVSGFKRGGKVVRKGKWDGGKAEKTPGEQMQDARKARSDAKGSLVSTGLGTLSSMIGAGTLAAESLPKVGKVIRAGVRAAIPLQAAGMGSAFERKEGAEREMKRLGEGKATDGEEDRKRGGKVGFKARLKRAVGGRAGEGDVEVRQSATDRAAEARSKASKADERAEGKAALGVLLTGGGLGTGMGARGKIAKGLGALATIGGIKSMADGTTDIDEKKQQESTAKDADWSAAGYERKSGGRAKLRKRGGKACK